MTVTDRTNSMREAFEKLYKVETPPLCIPIRTHKTNRINFINCNISVPKLNPNFHVITPNRGYLRIHEHKDVIKNIKGEILGEVFGITEFSGDLYVIPRGPVSVEAIENPGLVFDIHLWTLCPGTSWVYEADIKDCVICSYVQETEVYVLSFLARTCTGWTLQQTGAQ